MLGERLGWPLAVLLQSAVLLTCALLVRRYANKSAPLLPARAGGLLMGYGSRIAYGCNIGAFVSSISSTSLHGWLWILLALPGNWIGVKVRQRLNL